MELTDDVLMELLAKRFVQSRKALSSLSVLNLKLKEMNKRLKESESLKSNFLSNIRNEINNPLNGIIGLAGELITIKQGDDEVVNVASMICSEARNLDFKLRNIFVAAALEAGEMDPDIAEVNVSSLLLDLADSFRQVALCKSVAIKLNLIDVDQPLLFLTDADKLQTIISNLLANAVEFTPSGGEVSVFAAIDADGQLKVTVRDNGIGIPEKDHKRIFDRFVQLESGTTRSHLGQGLGLSIARALTDLLMGAIAVESSPGKGALFTVTLSSGSIADNDHIFAEAGNLFLFDKMSKK